MKSVGMNDETRPASTMQDRFILHHSEFIIQKDEIAVFSSSNVSSTESSPVIESS
jgi:hypothetical protein